MRIYLLCIPAISIYNTGTAVLRAVGNSKWPMVLLAICSAVNLALDMIIVSVFDLGIAGIAWTTFIAQAVSAAVILLMLQRTGD